MSKDKIERWNDVEGNLDNKELLQAFLDGNNNGFAILQLRLEPETKDERFESYEVLKNMGKEPNIDHYEVVYTSSLTPYIDKTAILESIYIKFNIDIPEDFKDRSLSVSDIVALKIDNNISFHYVDRFGFVELNKIQNIENYLKNTEMMLEDDYNMIDGIVNNGKKEELPSVLEQLKAKSIKYKQIAKPTHKKYIERQ